MRILGDFPNVEKAIVGWLKGQLDASFVVVNELPRDFATVTTPLTPANPLVLVEQIPGGGGEEIEVDTIVTVTVWAATIPLVWAACAPVEKAMVALPGRGPIMIDRLWQTSRFGRIPYANTNVKRAESTYRLTARPR